MSQPMPNTYPRHAFSLVELSIVLVILGLLVGGILGGQSLIRASELRAITTQREQFLTAINAFKERYQYFPGDMPNAVSFWGLAGGANGESVLCAAAASTTTATCNGTGDGRIRSITQGPEPTRFWQHLKNAGLIEGSFTGAYDGGAGHKTSVNSPAGKMSQTLWSIYDFESQSGNTKAFDGAYDNVLWIGGFMAAGEPFTPILKPEEMWNIDTKIDDGSPALGKVVVYSPADDLTDCTDRANPANLSANYLLTHTAKECIMMFRQAF